MAIDVATLIVSVLGGGTTAFGVLKWGSKPFFDRHLESHKAELARANALTLGDADADRKYRYEARQRLNIAVGPLRFQLVQAAFQICDRMLNIVENKQNLAAGGYFYRSTLYRLARLIALLEMIEAQIAYFDFSVDESMVRILRFRSLIFQAMSGFSFLLDHPGCDWTFQREHVFRDTLPVLAISMMSSQDSQLRLVRVDEFNAVLAQGGDYLEPLAGQIVRLHPENTPVMWIRIIAIATVCDALLQSEAALAEALGAKDYDFAPLLEASLDPFIVANRDAYAKSIGDLAAELN